MIKKTGMILSLLTLALLLATTAFCAEEGWQTWKEGRVTKAPWTEGKFSKIEVNGIPYTFMPESNLYQQKRQRNGGFSQRPIKAHQIYRTQDVNMLIQGFRIYQLHVMQ